MNSFLYLDEYKMYSISAQIFGGLTESVVEFSSRQERESEAQKGPFGSGKLLADIASEQTGKEEKKFLHDYAYTLFEEKLRDDGKLLELTDPLSETFKQDMEKTSFVKVTGRSLFTDVPLLTKLLSEFNSMGEAFTYLTTFAELSVVEGATEDKLKDVPDRNKKAALRQQIKNATHIKRLATEKGLQQDPTLLKHLTYLMTYMMKDDFEVQLSLASADDKQVFFKSPLNRESLREPCDAIIRKYSRQCEEPLTLFGIITQGRKDRTAVQSATPENPPENFRIALLRMVNATAAIEESFFGRLENEYVIDPVALFRQL